MEQLEPFDGLAEHLIAAAPAIVLVLDESGRIVRVNPYFEQLTGFSADEVSGREWTATVVPERFRDRIARVLSDTMSGASTSGTINPVLTRSGEERAIEWHNRALTSSTGAVLGVLSLGLDVTDRIAAEGRLRKREEELERSQFRLNEAQRLAKLGSWDLDLAHNTLSWSDEIFRIFEVDKRAFAVTYEAFLQAVHPDDRALVDEAFRTSVQTRTPYDLVHRLRLPDGHSKWVHERGETRYDDMGRPIRSLGTVQDITAQREAEERFRTLFQQAGVGVAEIDSATGRFLRVNSKCSEILGYTAGELLARDVRTITHHDDREETGAALERIRIGELRTLSFEKRCVRKGGSVVWVNMTVSALWKPGEPPSQYIAVAQDVTARIEAQRSRQQLEDQLRQSQKMEAIGTLAGGVAHDFNNLLMAIVGNLELARSLVPAQVAAQQHLDAIALASERARKLVQQILAFSRKQTPRRAPADLARLVHEAGGLLRVTIPAGIELQVQTPPLPLHVLADASQLHQVLMNLGTNAWHAVDPAGGKIFIGVGATLLNAENAARLDLSPGHYAEITVADDGHGMDGMTLERIFEPFFTTKEAGKGSGLGLSVAHGIVREHGGTIIVESTMGGGTTFRVFIPIVRDVAPAESGDERHATVRFSECVLFLDDDPAVAAVGRGLFERIGCSVDVFTDSDAAIAAVRKEPERYTLIVTDHNMPGRSGIAVTRELRRLTSTAQFVLVSGFENYSEEEVVQAGIDDRLQKPFGKKQLCALLERAAERRQTRARGSADR